MTQSGFFFMTEQLQLTTSTLVIFTHTAACCSGGKAALLNDRDQGQIHLWRLWKLSQEIQPNHKAWKEPQELCPGKDRPNQVLLVTVIRFIQTQVTGTADVLQQKQSVCHCWHPTTRYWAELHCGPRTRLIPKIIFINKLSAKLTCWSGLSALHLLLSCCAHHPADVD